MHILVVLLINPLGQEPVRFVDFFPSHVHHHCAFLSVDCVCSDSSLPQTKTLNLENFVLWAIMGKWDIVMFILFLENQSSSSRATLSPKTYLLIDE